MSRTQLVPTINEGVSDCVANEDMQRAYNVKTFSNEVEGFGSGKLFYNPRKYNTICKNQKQNKTKIKTKLKLKQKQKLKQKFTKLN